MKTFLVDPLNRKQSFFECGLIHCGLLQPTFPCQPQLLHLPRVKHELCLNLVGDCCMALHHHEARTQQSRPHVHAGYGTIPTQARISALSVVPMTRSTWPRCTKNMPTSVKRPCSGVPQIPLPPCRQLSDYHTKDQIWH